MKSKTENTGSVDQRFAVTSKKSGLGKNGQVLLATIPFPKFILNSVDEWQQDFQNKAIGLMDSPEFFWLPSTSVHIELLSFGEVDPSIQIPLKGLLEEIARLTLPFSLMNGKFVVIQKFKEQCAMRLEFDSCEPFQTFRSALESKVNDTFGTHFGKHTILQPFAHLGDVCVSSKKDAHFFTQTHLETTSPKLNFEVECFELLRTEPIFQNQAFKTVASFFFGSKNFGRLDSTRQNLI